MTTLLVYLVVLAVVGALLFLLASLVFGRGEELAPLPAATTPTVLPETDVAGTDVRELRFQLVVRGYKASEVDWALERLAQEIDRLRGLVPPPGAEPAGPPGPATESASGTMDETGALDESGTGAVHETETVTESEDAR